MKKFENNGILGSIEADAVPLLGFNFLPEAGPANLHHLNATLQISAAPVLQIGSKCFLKLVTTLGYWSEVVSQPQDIIRQ
jgi:hypothetical protein